MKPQSDTLIGHRVRIVDAKSRLSLEAFDGCTGIVSWVRHDGFDRMGVRLDDELSRVAPMWGDDAVIVEPVE